MALLFNRTTRNLSIKGVITLTTGEQIYLTAEDIVTYSGNSATGAEGIPLGTTESASFSLSLNNKNQRFEPALLDNAEVHMFLGIINEGTEEFKDFGVWYVGDSFAPEQSVSISLNGFDALATRFEAVYVDSPYAYPTTIGSLVSAVCTAAGIKLKRIDFPNAAVVIPSMPAWDEETTLRNILSYCAIAAGGFARIDRSGQLDIVSYSEGKEYVLGPDIYQTFSSTGGSAFSFNALEIILTDSELDNLRFAIDESILPNATNTIQVDQNPLMTGELIQSVVNELHGILLEAGDVSWGGDPAVNCGDKLLITDLRGKTHKILINSQSFEFGGGLRFTDSCVLPALNSVSGAAYSTSTNMFDSDGKIRATRISGLDQSVVRATAGHFERLTSQTIETDALTTNLLNAIDIKAKNISTESVTTSVLTSTIAAIVEASIKKLTSGIVATDELYASLANIIGLKVESLTASDIETDRLAAALAAFTVITAGTAKFDRATVQHLVAQALNLSFGSADEVFINNLRVAYAQLVQATIGNLVIKASDGKYYRIDVTSGGNVTATPASVSEGEIEAGQTGDGRVILETNITAESLNTSNLLATYALINRIDAARIDVDELFARRAFIDLLITTDISSNSYIQQSITSTVTGEVEQFARLDSDGLHVGEKGKPGEVLIDSDSVDVRVGGKVFSSFGDDYVEFGNQQMRRTSDGGIAFIAKEA